MNTPPDPGSSAEALFRREIDPAVPARQKAFQVTTQEWERLKVHIRRITAHESIWMAAASFFAAAGVSFGTGAGALTQSEGVDQRLLVFFFSATFVGLSVAVACAFGCIESRSRRKREIDSAIECMEDIERIYSWPEGT